MPSSGFHPRERRRLLTAGAAWALAVAAPPARGQDYPAKPVKLVIPFPAGGSSDGIGRQLADKLGYVLRQPVVVENKGGAGGIIGTDYVAKQPPDGYTLVLVDAFHTSTPIYTRKMPYDAVKDFTAVSLIGQCPAVLVAGPGFEPRAAQEALAFLKANPGRATMALVGTGSVVVDQFRARSGLQIQPIPYRGSSPALVDLMSGQVQLMLTTMASAGSHVKAGKLRVLAVTGTKRLESLPQVPTFNDLGIKGMDYEQWFGVLGPAQLPAPVVQKLTGAIAHVTGLPEVRERLAGLALEVSPPGPQEMRRKLEGEALRWRKLAQEMNIQPQDG